MLTPEELRGLYGQDYPKAVFISGVRYEFTTETRFCRYYEASIDEKRSVFQLSRFQDGTASITLDELVSEWRGWSSEERLGLIRGLFSLPSTREDLPDMIRFITYEGRLPEWSAVAQLIALRLPQDEAFEQLHSWLQKLGPADTANMVQALAMTGDPRVSDVLRGHLDKLWALDTLLDDDPFVNFGAAAAAFTVSTLLKLGVPPPEVADKVSVLAEHPNEYVRSLGQLLKSGPIQVV